MSYVIIFTPALAPAYMHLRGGNLFSLAAIHLQKDAVLIDKAVFLFGVAAIAYVLVAMQSHLERSEMGGSGVSVPDEIKDVYLYFIAIMTIVCAILIESGPTIITASYEEILAGSAHSTPLLVLVKLLFGGFWGMLFIFGRQNKWLFWIVTIIVFLWFFLHVRRVEAFGMVLMLVLWKRYSLNSIVLAVCLTIFIISQATIGGNRNVPLSEIGMSESAIKRYEEVEVRRAKLRNRKVAIPGGGSNIFLAYLHLVHERDSDNLTEDQKLTMSQWPISVVPNTFLKMLGMPPTKNEHELIYDALELEYVGGMHLLGAFYLNGGVWLVLIYGLFHGSLAREIDHLSKQHFYYKTSYGGKLSLFAASVFLVYQFRYHWYNPQTLFKALTYSVVVYLIVVAVSRWSDAKRRSNENG
jgi:hypothetical protein